MNKTQVVEALRLCANEPCYHSIIKGPKAVSNYCSKCNEHILHCFCGTKVDCGKCASCTARVALRRIK